MEEELIVSEEVIDVEIVEEGNAEAEVVEEVVFEEPLNFEEYDEFSLTRVVQRKLQEKSEQTVRETVATKEKSLNVNNIDKYLKYEEDEKELSRVENEQKRLLEQKLLESVADLTLQDDENADEGQSAKTISSVAVESKKLPNSKVNNTWVETKKLPPEAFETLRPNMALTYSFELDEFQKQAVMRLENREHVFVAAHTSAGKTVVAEYAIALALKNNTRAVYTSPIKALSNQKYRDFKEKFGADNVGIVTGDVSVNPEAKCLIMTTEIFRSMLYKGSDTIRDVEFVIFDEVHYVNDAERGVVWEEVIIMLQPHVCLIFLSATTPNAADFSDWIGRTKQKRVYLISTNKRPVPLHHFLYFDNEVYSLMEANNYKAQMIAHVKHLTAEKNKPKPPSAENQQMANQRKQEKAAIAAQAAGGNKAKQQQIMNKVMNGGGRGSASSKGSSAGAGQQKGSNSGTRSQWNTLIKLLQQGGREAAGGLGEVKFGVATSRTVLSAEARKEKEDKYIPYERLPEEIRAKMTRREYEKEEFRGTEDEPEHSSDFRRNDMGLLPVVVFSFSKKKCEEIADFLKGQDLLTRKEKGKVFVLFENILSRLQPIDHDLPQILRMKEMLLRGIGVHHSGLLPILKETVEILFSQSIVKVLLATETFAMGVNMPARSVVFNGYRKHDGKEFRDLLPGEYIQMAGRAGRRGLDQVGTVILAAWLDIPEELGIKTLLTGKPTILSSQFRLRYNMILNLIRVNNMTIQDMIKSSFTEFASQKMLSNHNLIHKLTRYETYLEHLKKEHYQACWEYLTTSSPHANDYLDFERSDDNTASLSGKANPEEEQTSSKGMSLPSGVGVFTASATTTEDPLIQEMVLQRQEEKRVALLKHYYEEISTYAKTYEEIQSLFHKQLFDLISWNVGNSNQNGKKTSTPSTMIDSLFASGHFVHVWDNQYATYPIVATILANVADTKAYFSNPVDSAASSIKSQPASEKKLSATDKLSVGKGTGATSDLASLRASLMATNQKTSKPTAAPTATNTATAAPGAFTNESMTSLLNESFVYVMSIFPSIDLLPQWCQQELSKSGTLPQTAENFGTIHDFLVQFTAKKAVPSKSLSDEAKKELVFFGYQTELQHYYLIFPVPLSSIYTLYTPPSTLNVATTPVSKHSVVQLLEAMTLGIVFDADTSNETEVQSNRKREIEWVDYHSKYTIKDVAFVDRYAVLQRYSKYLRQFYVYQYLFPSTSASGSSTNSTLLPPLPIIFPHVTTQTRIQKKIECIEHFISDESMSLFPDLTQRVQVLSALAYLDTTSSVITKKGRVACELNTCDELLGTEMLFHNVLEPLNPPEAVGILSALVFQERGSGDSKDKDEIPQGDPLTTRMEVAKEELMTIYFSLKSLQECFNIQLDLELKPILNFGLCSVVYQWARGMPFKEIVAMSEFQEGSIVRCITRLDELCRDIQNAARVMGNMSLYYKMEAASQCIKRDIVFAASLYIV